MLMDYIDNYRIAQKNGDTKLQHQIEMQLLTLGMDRRTLAALALTFDGDGDLPEERRTA